MTEPSSIFPSLLDGLGEAVRDPRLWFVFGVALIGGVVRGFSGFGGALIVIPLAAMALGPVMAVPMFYLFDLGSATPYGYSALPRAQWREIGPMIAGYLVTLPLGAWMLTSLDPLAVRWFMDGIVLLMLAILVSGWRYHGRPTAPASAAVGCLAGAMGGSSGISGPPVIAYWMGRKENAAAIRTNIMAYYALSSTATDVLFAWRGLFTLQVLIYAIIIWPAYALGLAGGVRLFGFASDRAFRVSAYALIAIAAVLSLPLLDPFLK